MQGAARGARVAPNTAGVVVAQRVLSLRHVKDILYIGLTVAFFAVSWLYAKSFDRL
jgi:hypothetical protein